MSTELDCYGMTPEERAEFEAWVRGHGFEYLGLNSAVAGEYQTPTMLCVVTGWAACAKLYRERLKSAEMRDMTISAIRHELCERIKELEAENIRAWGEYNNAQAEARSAHTEHLALIGRAVAAEKRVKELDAEIERLGVDAVRLDWLDQVDCGFDHAGYGEYHHYTGRWRTARAVIDAAMKGGE